MAGTIRKLPEEGARRWIESGNAAIATLADQEVTPELAESGRRERHAPWGIQRSLRSETTEQVAVQIELIDKSISRAGDVIVPGRVLQRVSDIQSPANVLDIERRKAHRDRWIAKTRGKRGGRIGGVKDVDRVPAEIGGIKEICCPVVTDRKSLIDHACGPSVHRFDDGSRSRRPTGNSAVFRCENETRRRSGRDLKVGTAVKNNPVRARSE